MFGISDIAETVAMRRDSLIRRFMSNSAVCEICCAVSGHFVVRLFMAALCNRETLYFCPVVSSFFLLFFPRLISAFAEWMSTILLHMVWP